MFTNTTQYVKPLGNNLVLKSVGSLDDIERLAVFNGQMHGEILVNMTRALILHHPHTRPEHWLFIEDESTGQIVSALCLIPWKWRFDNIELKAGEMGIVGTLEGYRNRGLIRALDVRFKELLIEGEYDISQIEGIPYFYRVLGYEYALPLEGGYEIQPYQIPDGPTDDYCFRPATAEDIPVIMRFAEEAAEAKLNLSSVRSEAVWRYLFDHQSSTCTLAENWIIENRSAEPVGYWRNETVGFGTGLTVNETSRLSPDLAVALLRHLKTMAVERNKPYIRMAMHPSNDLIRTAIHWTAKQWVGKDEAYYAWQLYLPDVLRLLRTMIPLFEKRIAESDFAGLTHTLVLNLYRRAYTLTFEAGKLTTVEDIGFRNWELEGVRFPPQAFTQLVVGYRSHRELHQIYPDVGVWGQDQHLVDVLFPKTSAYFTQMY